jgi:hypothetical protein
VGVLKDGKTRGFQLLVLSVPYRGRAIPFHFLSFSSRTIAQGESSRNLEHLKAFLGVKELLGRRPLVLDREFSYAWLLRQLEGAGSTSWCGSMWDSIPGSPEGMEGKWDYPSLPAGKLPRGASFTRGRWR